MNPRFTLSVAIAALLLFGLSVVAVRATRPLQQAREPGVPNLPGPPMVAAGPLPTVNLPRFVPRASLGATKSPRPKAKGKKNLASTPQAPEILPPPSILIAPQPNAGPALPDVPRLPRPALPALPARDLGAVASGTIALPGASIVLSPPAAPPPAGGEMASAAGPADSNNVWEEKPSGKEQPEIRVYNNSRLSGELIIQATRRQSWSWRRPGLVIESQVEPIAYTYEVRGPIYRVTGQPDLAGTLRCRKFRLYEIELYERAPWEGWGTIRRDLGD
jgi:hypothetical protein